MSASELRLDSRRGPVSDGHKEGRARLPPPRRKLAKNKSSDGASATTTLATATSPTVDGPKAASANNEHDNTMRNKADKLQQHPL